jgi:hypothetical protein
MFEQRLVSVFVVLFLLGACHHKPKPEPKVIIIPGTIVLITQAEPAAGTAAVPVTVYVSFGADSAIRAADWASWCTTTSALTCNFNLTGSKALPNPDGKYLNMTMSVGAPVGCGVTKAEINVNNPNWYDTLDVSLVDGYNGNMEIHYTPPTGPPTILGPLNGQTGNENVLGVFPYGCDICVAQQNPPCGIPPGGSGCKAGTQYDPKPPCQFQGAVKGGGGIVEVILGLAP